MGLFRRKEKVEMPVDRNDPAAALARAQEALEKTHFATDDQGRYHPIGDDLRAELEAGLSRAQAGLDGGGATVISGGGAGAGRDPITQLERLAKLHEQGVLTDEELEEQKRRVLGES